MSDSGSERDPVEALAEEFLERQRRGERPDVEEYVRRYPQWADRIRKVFRALALLEDARPAGEHTGSVAGRAADAAGPALQRLGDYRIIREVGRGGMGVVYEAEQVSLGRHVALKVLPHKLPDDRARRRFEREAKAAARLHHTNIVPVFGVGEHDGLPFYAMQFIQGLGLDEVLRELKRLQPGPKGSGGEPHVFHKDLSAADVARSLVTGRFAPAVAPEVTADHARPGNADPGPSPSDPSSPSSSSAVLPGAGPQPGGKPATYWQSVARIGVQVADALEHAHRQGVLHRDVKPSNLLLDARGTVWVTDFGLAKADDQQNLTHTGDLLGTLRYLPPEAFDGKADARGDVYSLGLTLYELLAFRPAFDEADRNKLIKQVTAAVPPRLGRLAPAMPRDLATVVEKAIDRDPARRYQTAGELAADLQRFLDDVPIRARRVSATERLWRWGRRNPVIAGLTAATALLLVAVAVSATLAAVQFRLKAEAEARAKDELETTLYFHRIALAHRELLENNLLQAEALLDQCPADRRAWEWYYLKRLCHVEPVTLRGQPGWGQTVAFSPDGRRLATASEDKTVKIWDAATGQELLTLPDTGEVFCATFRPPDGRWLITGDRSGAVTAWDTTARRVVRTFGRHKDTVRALAVSSDGRLVSSASEDKTVRVWDATSGEVVHDLIGHEHRVATVAFSPDGRLLASGSFDTTVKIWDTTTGKPIRTLRGHQYPVSGVAFSPDGRRLASASIGRAVKIWDLTTGQEALTLDGHVLQVYGVAFLDGGRRLASVSVDKTMKIWDATTGQVVLTLRGHTQDLSGLACSPDGRRVASTNGDGTTKIWDATPLGEAPAGQEALTLRGHTDQVWGLAFSPDGARLASASWDATVRVWDAWAGREDLSFRNHPRVVFGVAFRPDGRRLASSSVQHAEDEPGPLKVWDATTGRELLDPRGNTNTREAFCVAFSPDGHWIVTGTRGGVTVWGTTTGQVNRTLGPHGLHVFGLAFSPDGGRLASLSSDGRVTVFDATRWGEKPLFDFRAHKTSVRGSLAFSPDGKRLVMPGDENTVNIWDVTTTDQPPSAPQLTLRGHTAQVWGVAFSPDGRWVASGGEDNTVKLWDATTGGEPVRSFRGHASVVSRVAFSPNGERLASASFDKTVKVWDLTHLAKKLK